MDRDDKITFYRVYISLFFFFREAISKFNPVYFASRWCFADKIAFVGISVAISVFSAFDDKTLLYQAILVFCVHVETVIPIEVFS